MADEASAPEEIREITFEDLKSGLLAKALVLIDVRNPDELLTQGAIDGAVNIPLPEVPDAFKNLNDEEFKLKYAFDKNSKDLVFSCRSGKRAEAAIDNLKGVIPNENIWLYRGSFMDWEAKGGPITKKAAA